MVEREPEPLALWKNLAVRGTGTRSGSRRGFGIRVKCLHMDVNGLGEGVSGLVSLGKPREGGRRWKAGAGSGTQVSRELPPPPCSPLPTVCFSSSALSWKPPAGTWDLSLLFPHTSCQLPGTPSPAHGASVATSALPQAALGPLWSASDPTPPGLCPHLLGRLAVPSLDSPPWEADVWFIFQAQLPQSGHLATGLGSQ